MLSFVFGICLVVFDLIWGLIFWLNIRGCNWIFDYVFVIVEVFGWVKINLIFCLVFEFVNSGCCDLKDDV